MDVRSCPPRVGPATHGGPLASPLANPPSPLAPRCLVEVAHG